MKNKYFLALVAFCMMSSAAMAQSVPNFSFENWALDTNYLSLPGLTNPVLHDTSISSEPLLWTTSNSITNGSTLKNTVLATQSSTSYVGSSSLELRSDSINTTIHNIVTLGQLTLNFVCPGFAVCGKFPINLSALANLSSGFNPATLPGAGIPISGRKMSIGGYMKYIPQGGDTAYVIAILRQGATVVAQATYLRATTDANFSYFEVPFIYQNCLEPDTMVYTISSGNPYSISNVVTGGSTGLTKGSTLYVDSVFMRDTVAGFAVPPITMDDAALANENSFVVVQVGINDVSCYVTPMTAAVSAQPMHGTAVAHGDSITYTPATNFFGQDTFYYTATVGGSAPSTPAMVVMQVVHTAAITEVNDTKIKIYPNPTSGKLHISAANTAISHLRVVDMLGQEVKSESINASSTLDVSSFDNGLYIIQFSNNEGKILTSSRFTVIK